MLTKEIARLRGVFKQCKKSQAETTEQRDKRLCPAMLTCQIKEAETIDMLIEAYSLHESLLSHIHLSDCWVSLGRLARKPAEQHNLQMNAGTLEPLV